MLKSGVYFQTVVTIFVGGEVWFVSEHLCCMPINTAFPQIVPKSFGAIHLRILFEGQFLFEGGCYGYDRCVIVQSKDPCDGAGMATMHGIEVVRSRTRHNASLPTVSATSFCLATSYI